MVKTLKNSQERYVAENIKVLEGLEAVRTRPGMYIGSTGISGLHHILWEIIDNAVDEACNGYAKKITVILYKDGSASVEDDGRGIPTDIHPKMKVSGVQVVFTQLHAGGKFDENNYAFSGGLHGVGASVTNALSEWLTVNVFKNGTTYEMNFHSYYDERKKKVLSGIPIDELHDTGKATNKKGTFVRFLPDKRVFKDTTFDYGTISARLREIAFLNNSTTIVLKDEKSGKSETFKYTDGVVDFVKYLVRNDSTLYDNPICLHGEKDGIVMDIAIAHTNKYDETIASYVNNIPTKSGGMHEQGFHSGLTRMLNEYARKTKVLKEKDANFTGDDFKEGLTVVLSIKMKNAQFEGQTKDRLGNPEARTVLDNYVYESLTYLSNNKKQQSCFQAIMKKAQTALKARNDAKKAKELARANKEVDKFNLVGKLANCSGRKAELNELFIVEGDSAGGSAKQARMRQTQAILPLRGKPLNVEKQTHDRILANEEIKTIISAIGAGWGSKFDVDEINYNKVVILSDADQDGAHIRIILLTFFYRYMPELIRQGHVYIGMPPLYKVYKNNVVEYAYDDTELEAAKAKVGRGALIQRYKGLGEMDPSQLWETTMNPATRTLMQVKIDSEEDIDELITVLMGDKVEGRKQYIFDNANFNKVDTFMKEIKLKGATE